MTEVLTFPTCNKGRIRKSRSPEAMGRCSISLLERDGEDVPTNITDFRTAKPAPDVDDGRLALLLALALFAQSSAGQKKELRKIVRSIARHDDDRRGDECRALYPLLTGEQPSC